MLHFNHRFMNVSDINELQLFIFFGIFGVHDFSSANGVKAPNQSLYDYIGVDQFVMILLLSP